jgi:hypothetical protein
VVPAGAVVADGTVLVCVRGGSALSGRAEQIASRRIATATERQLYIAEHAQQLALLRASLPKAHRMMAVD